MTAYDASPDIAAAAAAGPHSGWSTFDAKLEGSRFHLMHAAVSARAFDPHEAGRLAGELEELAQSYGYGSADGYLMDAAGLTDDEIDAKPELAILRDHIFESPAEEDPYFAEIRNSERILAAAAATPEASAYVGADGQAWPGGGGPIHERMLRAFERGRDMRASQDFGQPPSP